MLDGVQWADWSPDGRDLAVVRDAGGRNRLEYPIGKPLYETGGWIGHPRVSPKGDLIAFADHPLQGDDSGSPSRGRSAREKKTLSDSVVHHPGLGLVSRRQRNLVHRQQVRHGSHSLRHVARRQAAHRRPPARRSNAPRHRQRRTRAPRPRQLAPRIARSVRQRRQAA